MFFLNFSIIQKNRVFFLIVLIILSLLTVSVPHYGGEAYAHHTLEMMVKQTVVSNKSTVCNKKFIES